MRNTGLTLRLKGKGINDGDELVTLKVMLPKTIDREFEQFLAAGCTPTTTPARADRHDHLPLFTSLLPPKHPLDRSQAPLATAREGEGSGCEAAKGAHLAEARKGPFRLRTSSGATSPVNGEELPTRASGEQPAIHSPGHLCGNCRARRTGTLEFTRALWVSFRGRRISACQLSFLGSSPKKIGAPSEFPSRLTSPARIHPPTSYRMWERPSWVARAARTRL